MTCLESCILILVIGIVVTFVAGYVIGKIFEENRKSAAEGWKSLGNTMEGLATGIMKVVEEAQKKEEEKKKQWMTDFRSEQSE